MPEKESTALRGQLLKDRNFFWLLAGALISMLGDQFTLIALPWLVLKMTGDTLALGTVLALVAVPRALFILIGGAVVDRYSPKRVMMLTKYINTLLLGVLAALVLTGAATLWMVYALALCIGLSTAFSIPSGTAIMQHVVPREHLQAANSMMMGLRQLSMFAGPLLAGVLIALSGNEASGAVTDAKGLGLAFLFDAFSFALSAWTLAKVGLRTGTATQPAGAQSTMHAVAEGLRHCWNDRSLRTCFLYWAAVAFFVSGPIQVAMPVLADGLPQGAAAFGALAGAYGAGTLVGMIVSGIKPKLRVGNLGMTMLLIDAVIGALFIPVGLISAAWQGVVLLLAIGVLGGFLQVTVYTWLQGRVPPAMLGRTMSVFMFIFMGIAPMAAAATGWVMRVATPAQLFIGSGALLLGIVATTFATSGMRFVADAGAMPQTRP
ncbi:MFS transporter [Noviherbaspirillum cavernae]|uniref:MFS transporter n=1 Tax=Noviherbaspirillum cavernae TaxID=2320862 RepID=A0A418X5A0_9BURK|nr:MFS transporter [Noviherbaspirillum cavernae]RJG07664.1 MFS transporter [Noviherbaspirillum cavernae]